MWVTVPPPPPGVPVGPNWHPGRGTPSILSPDRQPTAPRSLRQDRKAQSSLRGHPRPRGSPCPGPICTVTAGVAGQQATCPAGQELPGGLGRAGLAGAGRAGLGRSRGQQGALQERLGDTGLRPQGNCPRQPRSDIGLPAGNHPPPPGPAHPSLAHAHQLTPRAESLSVGHLTLTRAAPGTGHRDSPWATPLLGRGEDELLSLKEGAPFSAGREAGSTAVSLAGHLRNLTPLLPSSV